MFLLVLKGIVYPKRKIISPFTCIVPNLCTFKKKKKKKSLDRIFGWNNLWLVICFMTMLMQSNFFLMFVDCHEAFLWNLLRPLLTTAHTVISLLCNMLSSFGTNKKLKKWLIYNLLNKKPLVVLTRTYWLNESKKILIIWMKVALYSYYESWVLKCQCIMTFLIFK